MSRFYHNIYLDNEFNAKTATVRQDMVIQNAISVAQTITVADATLTAATINVVSNTETLITTINTVSASNPDFGIRYDGLVADSGQPDVSNLIVQALMGYSPSSNTAITVANLIASSIETSNLAADNFVVGDLDAYSIEAGDVGVNKLSADSIEAGNVGVDNLSADHIVANVLNMTPYRFVSTSNGFVVCHLSNNTSQQQAGTLAGYNVLAVFSEEC